MSSQETAVANERPIDERVYAAITAALLQGKLAPGAQLVERDLAAAFDCTRGTIRKVLARLGVEGKVVLAANRGAFVPSPSEADIRRVYRARQVMEAGVAVTLCGALSAAQQRALRAHVKLEEKALKEGRVADSVRLAGQFHLLLTALAGAPDLDVFAGQLVAKTELYKALYDPSKASGCSAAEHRRLIDALAAGDLPAALDTLRTHLDELEARVIAQVNTRGEGDLASLLRGG